MNVLVVDDDREIVDSISLLAYLNREWLYLFPILTPLDEKRLTDLQTLFETYFSMFLIHISYFLNSWNNLLLAVFVILLYQKYVNNSTKRGLKLCN